MTTSREAEKLVSDLKTVVRDGENLLRASGQELNTKTREGLRESLAVARETCQAAERKCGLLAKRACETAKEHPYMSVGVALGLGMIVGAWILRDK